MALARAGAADAFDQLVARHQAAAYRAAFAALRNREEAEDAAQDGLVRAWANLDRFRGQASFRTWLLSIVWNAALSRRRSMVRWLRQRVAIHEAIELPAVAAGPYGELRQREVMAHVATAIDRLTPKLRDALLLAQSGEYDYDEISLMLNIPVGTLKWRVSEARKKVKNTLQVLGHVHGS